MARLSLEVAFGRSNERAGARFFAKTSSLARPIGATAPLPISYSGLI
ncbi:hypothetical protein [Sphingomonas sp. Y38-1Y]|nr:hypothetical protein [Sphingomonas sp. Y38-1Y]